MFQASTIALALVLSIIPHAWATEPEVCNTDLILNNVFDSIGDLCISESGVDINAPWDPTDEDIAAICANTHCRTIYHRISDLYPNDCLWKVTQKPLRLGLFGNLECMAGCGPTETPMSVEGVYGVFCVAGPACSGGNSTGACPLPRYPNLQYGAGCGIVASGVYGCKPYVDSSQTTLAESPKRDPSDQCVGNAGGDVPVSVLGLGTFCTSEPVCSGTQRGNCPNEASGLTQAARCDYVSPGVLGCMV